MKLGRMLLGLAIAILVSSDCMGQSTIVRGIYYAKNDNIYRTDADGNGETLVIEGAGSVHQIKIASSVNKVFWSTSDNFYQANLDGSERQIVAERISASAAPGFAVDNDGSEIYYVGHQPNTGFGEKLLRKTITTGAEAIIMAESIDLLFIHGLLLDESTNYLYVDFLAGEINRIAAEVLDQPFSSLETVVGSVFSDGAIDLNFTRWYDVDPSSQYLYYSQPGEILAIARRDLSSSQMTLKTLIGFTVEGLTSQQSGIIRSQHGTNQLYLYGNNNGATGLYRFEFPDGAIVPLTNGGVPFALDLVGAGVSDEIPPEVTLFSPSTGTTTNQIVSLAGFATDNNALAGALWELNGETKGSLALGDDGTFGTSKIALMPGENTLFVDVTDLDGNVGRAEVAITWEPLLHLALGDVESVFEGDSISIPVTLNSVGDVSGMTFDINYDETYLGSPEFVVGGLLEEAAVTVNATALGRVRVTFAMPVAAIGATVQLLGDLKFRVRSVPNDLTSELTIAINDVSDPLGNPLIIGNFASGTDVRISGREYLGDINTNGQLDVGDASLMQRFLADFEARQVWDDALNDLNGNDILDSGDVVNVLRTVVGLLPQPSARLPQVLALGSAGPSNYLAGPRAYLLIDNDIPNFGDTVTVRVFLDDLGTNISGASLTLDYPVDAFRIEDSASHAIGNLVEGGSFVLWNVAPGGTNYVNQSGSVTVGMSSSIDWPGSGAGGEVAVIRFRVQSAFADEAVRRFQLRNVSVTFDGGYGLAEPLDDVIALVTESMSYQQWTATQFTTAELADPDVSGWVADPDEDGISNGQDYFQGGKAKDGRGEIFEASVYASVGRQVPLIALDRSLMATRMSMALEVSLDLQGWTPVPSKIYSREATGSETVERIYVGPETDFEHMDQFFLRLQLTDHSAEF